MNLFGTPTYIPHLAEALIKLSKMKDAPKIVHIAGEDVLSRYEFALMIAGVFGYNKELILPAKWKWDMKSANRPKKAGLKTNLAKKIGVLLVFVSHSTLETQIHLDKINRILVISQKRGKISREFSISKNADL